MSDRTIIVVPSQDASYQLNGINWTSAQIVLNYASDIPGIGTMTCTESLATTADGQVKTMTFQPRVGNKG